MTNTKKLAFASDYQQGAHPDILKRLSEINLQPHAGYGTDEISASAREKIRAACAAPEADVFFLAGGTQTNALIIGACLQSYQGVLAAETGHVSLHEAGAVELGGHKVMTLPQQEGKLSAETVRGAFRTFAEDENRDHMVMPGMVYLSQPTEYGTLYSLKELEEISRVTHAAGALLYVDGARLAYALGCPANDVTLADLARLCDAFYIGGTKCGALFGEAVVFPKKDTVPHFFTIIKQHGALLAKGFVTGLQFDVLFTDGLYEFCGRHAIAVADRIRDALSEKGYAFAIDSPTNQLFLLLDRAQEARLTEKIEMSFWERPDEDHVVMRIATCWATTEEEADALIALL
ncbi:MAG: aminotransferase class V-fold PLP-dependent enzyme [Lachnospiraceae bacterium]|nr:aminotransferase class V-fold PLP-dependent enzyme [Lachnospiraceae bacterium]